MRGLGTGLLLLWIIIHEGSCNYADILWGQCHAFCLKRHQSRLQETVGLENVSVRTELVIRDCRRDRECKWCLFACQRPRKDYGDHKDCLKDCRNPRTRRHKAGREACADGCNFIAESSASKFGTCPSPEALSIPHESCIQECQADVRCSGMKKCCDTTCGQICHPPQEQDAAFPAMPTDLQFKQRHDGGLLVEWSGREGESYDVASPVIYILRWWCSYMGRVLYSITTKPRVKLRGYPDGVHPAVKCNYMVASVNTRGSKGFTESTVYIKRFLHPSKPLNLEKTRTRLHDGKVDITVRWQPPEYTDGKPVDRYLVFWSDGLPRAGASYMRLHMHRKVIKLGRTSYTIPSLEPGVMYFVQVRAVVQWKGKSIRGRPASTYVEAFSAPRPALHGYKSWTPEQPLSAAQVYDIMVDEPTFVDAELTARASWSLYSDSTVDKYILYWTLDVCDGEAKHRKTPARLTQQASTHKQEFHMNGLESDCVYELKIHTVDFSGELGEGQIQYFRTPLCVETKGRPQHVVCQAEASPPLPPMKLVVSFRSTCMCQAVVSWQHPDASPSQDHSIVSSTPSSSARAQSYSVEWGQSRPPAQSYSSSFDTAGDVGSQAIVYNVEPHRLEVSGTESQACMRRLEPDRHYTVQVVSQTPGQQSPPAIRHFTTPADAVVCHAAGTGEAQQGRSSRNVTDLSTNQADYSGPGTGQIKESRGGVVEPEMEVEAAQAPVARYRNSTSSPSLHTHVVVVLVWSIIWTLVLRRIC